MVTTDEVRRLALSFPEAEEFEHWGKTAFRFRTKVFAILQPDGLSLVIKTTKEDRFTYTTIAPDIYRLPDSFRNLAFMVVRLDLVDPQEFHELIELAWRLVSPKSIGKAYDDRNKARHSR